MEDSTTIERRIERFSKFIPGFSKLIPDEQRSLVVDEGALLGTIGIISPDLGVDGCISVKRVVADGQVDLLIFPMYYGDASPEKEVVWMYHSPLNDGSKIRKIAVTLLRGLGLNDAEIEDVLIDMGAQEVANLNDPETGYVLFRKARLERLLQRGLPDRFYGEKIGRTGPIPDWEKELQRKIAEKSKAQAEESVSDSSAASEPSDALEPPKTFVGLPKPAAPKFSEPTTPTVPPAEAQKPDPTPTEPENPVPPTDQPPVKREWLRAKSIFRWARQNAPALVVGGLTGAGVRIAAQFALAAFVTTTPGVVAAIGSAMAIGALAGGVSKLVTTSIWGGAQKDNKHWKRKAFLQGAAMGAVGAGIGAGVAQWLISHDYLHGWFGNEGTSPSEVHGTVTPPDHTVPSPVDQGHIPSGGESPAQPVIPPHGPEVTPDHVVPTPDQTVVPSPSTDVPSHPAATAPADTPAPHAPAPSGDGAAPTDAPSVGTEHTTPSAHSDAPPAKAPQASMHQPAPAHESPSAPPQDTPSAPPADTTQPVVPQGSLRDFLTEEQFKKLPRGVRSLASSTNPREIALFCKEASFNLINGVDRSPEALQAGAKLIERGVEVAKTAGLDNTVTKMLHADLAYLKAWGIGTDKNVEVALTHAKQAGTVMHNYGGRLLSLLGRLTNG